MTDFGNLISSSSKAVKYIDRRKKGFKTVFGLLIMSRRLGDLYFLKSISSVKTGFY